MTRTDTSVKVFYIRDVPNNTIVKGTLTVRFLAWIDDQTNWTYTADLFNSDTNTALSIVNGNVFTGTVGAISTVNFNVPNNVTWTNSLFGLQVRFVLVSPTGGTTLRM
jgi:hypothetical protein